MALVTRTAKGSKLTITEMDDNLTYLEDLALGSGVKYYKALISQEAPVASQTSGTVTIGSIWTINTFESGDDFSNWELISGTGNTTGDVYRALTTAPTDWTNGSDLEYDGAPFIVSKNSDGDFAPFINTIGAAEWQRIDEGDFHLEITGGFPEGKVICKQPTFDWDTGGSVAKYYIGRVDNDNIGLYVEDYSFNPEDNFTTTIEIEVYP